MSLDQALICRPLQARLPISATARRAVQPSGPEAIEKQHARGKNTARERIDLLLDAGSFVEFDALAVHRSTAFGMEKKKPLGDGLVSGYGTVDGRPVAVYSQDFSVYGGSLSQVNGEKIVKVQEFALRNGCPVVGILDGGGARIQEGVASLAMFADIFRNNVHASGVVPQISLIMGPSAGGAAYSPALTDYVVMVDKTSPHVHHRPGRHQDRHRRGRGHGDPGRRAPAQRHHRHLHLPGLRRGGRDRVRPRTAGLPALQQPRRGPGRWSTARNWSSTTTTSPWTRSIPDSANQPYDMRKVIEQIVDDAHFLEMQSLYAPNVIIGYGRVEGHTVGIVANQPMQFAGTLDIAASEKAARFVRHCDAFNIPIITLVDVPGFLPGKDQEFQGIIRRGAKLLYAYAEATVPKLTVITRKAYGGAYIVMGSKKLGADLNLAWPTAQIGVMGAQGAVNILYRRELAAVAEAGGDVEAQPRRGHPAVRGGAAQPVPGCPAGLRGRGHRPVRDPRCRSSGACAPCGTSGPACPPRSTGTSRCEHWSEAVDTAETSDGFQHGDAAIRQQPLLTVVKGDPTPEELAALTAVVAALQSSGQAGTPARRPGAPAGRCCGRSSRTAPEPGGTPSARSPRRPGGFALRPRSTGTASLPLRPWCPPPFGCSARIHHRAEEERKAGGQVHDLVEEGPIERKLDVGLRRQRTGHHIQLGHGRGDSSLFSDGDVGLLGRTGHRGVLLNGCQIRRTGQRSRRVRDGAGSAAGPAGTCGSSGAVQERPWRRRHCPWLLPPPSVRPGP